MFFFFRHCILIPTSLLHPLDSKYCFSALMMLCLHYDCTRRNSPKQEKIGSLTSRYRIRCQMCLLHMFGLSVGPVTRRSRLEKRRDEMRRDRLDLVSSRDFISRDGLDKKFSSRSKNSSQKVKKLKNMGLKSALKSGYVLCLVSRLVS